VLKCEIRKTFNVEKHLPSNGEIAAALLGPRDQNVPGKTGEANPAG